MYQPNIDKAKLLERLRFSMTKKEVLQIVESFSTLGIDVNELISLSIQPDQSVGFHSAWVLENMLIGNPHALDYYLPSIIEHLPKTKNPSVRRHLSKIVVHGINRIVKRKASKLFEKEFWAINLEPLEEACFRWFVDEKTKPAVKAHSLDILCLLSTRQRWIAQELPHIIENQMELGTPAIRAKGKKVLKKLSRIKNDF